MAVGEIAPGRSPGETQRVVESGRFNRALTEDMTVECVADQLFEVHSQSGSTYDVDVRSGACSCPDSEKRGDVLYCKHVLRCALVETVRARKARSMLAALAVSASIEVGCVVEGHGGRCNGPVRSSDDGGLPCPSCCNCVRSSDTDEYDVWSVVTEGGR